MGTRGWHHHSCIREKATPEEPAEPGKRGLIGTQSGDLMEEKVVAGKEQGDRVVGQPSPPAQGCPLLTSKMDVRVTAQAVSQTCL